MVSSDKLDLLRKPLKVIPFGAFFVGFLLPNGQVKTMDYRKKNHVQAMNRAVREKFKHHEQEFEKVWRALSRGDAQVRAVAESVRLINERQARYGNIIIGFTLCLMVKELGLFTVLKGLLL